MFSIDSYGGNFAFQMVALLGKILKHLGGRPLLKEIPH